MTALTETELLTHSLDKIRQRLLDLSKHNPLLNYQASPTRTVDIAVDVALDELYQRLVLDNEALRLTASDEVIAPSETLFMPTAHAASQLAQNCKKLARQAQTAVEETGSNILYLALGVLHWYPDAKQTELLHAPLLLVPVKCVRQRLSGYPVYQYWLSYNEEDIEVNPSLSEKLSRDFQLTLPEFKTSDTPTAYLTQLNAQLQPHVPTWEVVNCALLDLFSFTRLLMYRDLDPQSQRSLLDNPRLRHMLLNQTATGDMDETVNKPHHPVAATPTELTNVLAADSSQQAVIQAVLQGQLQIAVEGPPGTGKSQTITNLIANLFAQGKSVLFVAEKKAALDVVKRRLEQVGLSDFCLDLHSHKTRKGQIYQAIQQRLDATYPEPTQLATAQAQLTTQKKNYKIMCSDLTSPSGR